MKRGFSFSDAITAPLILLRQRPFSLFVWGLAMIALVVAMYSQLLPLLLDLPLSTGGEAAMDAYQAEMMRIQAVSNGLTALIYVVLLVLSNAAGRATLSPGVKDRFLFMRLGMDEVRVAVVVVGAFLGWYLVILVVALTGMAVGFAAWSFGQVVGIAAIIAFAALAMVMAVFGWARLSLMGPATLILGRFAFAEGWAIGRGQTLKLAGMHLVLWFMAMLACLVALAVVGVILVAGFLLQGLTWPDVVETPQDLLPLVEPMTLPLLAIVPVMAWVYGGFIALNAAPTIRAARQLLDGLPSHPLAGADVVTANP